MSYLLMRVSFVREFPGLGEQVKKLRLESGKPLAVLASEAGISVPHWHRIENERVKILPEEVVKGIEKALNADLGVIIND